MNYEQGKIAVDAVIFTIQGQDLLVFLNEREKDPYRDLPELPGGLLLQSETAEEALSRKLKDIVGTDKVFFQQFYTFTEPYRDPRGRIISIGFIALVSSEKLKNTKNFYQVKTLSKLAFDHQEIIKKALKFLEQNSEKLAKQFMPATFPLNDLQTVYEITSQKKFDNRNFRKKILESGILKKIDKMQENVAHRPATLYKFTGSETL